MPAATVAAIESILPLLFAVGTAEARRAADALLDALDAAFPVLCVETETTPAG